MNGAFYVPVPGYGERIGGAEGNRWKAKALGMCDVPCTHLHRQHEGGVNGLNLRIHTGGDKFVRI